MSNYKIPIGKVEGPTRVIPTTPQPYLSCENCIHLHKTIAHTGKGSNAPTWHKVCHHVSMVVGKTMCLNNNPTGDLDQEARTPDCCPYLNL